MIRLHVFRTYSQAKYAWSEFAEKVSYGPNSDAKSSASRLAVLLHNGDEHRFIGLGHPQDCDKLMGLDYAVEEISPYVPNDVQRLVMEREMPWRRGAKAAGG